MADESGGGSNRLSILTVVVAVLAVGYGVWNRFLDLDSDGLPRLPASIDLGRTLSGCDVIFAAPRQLNLRDGEGLNVASQLAVLSNFLIARTTGASYLHEPRKDVANEWKELFRLPDIGEAADVCRKDPTKCEEVGGLGKSPSLDDIVRKSRSSCRSARTRNRTAVLVRLEDPARALSDPRLQPRLAKIRLSQTLSWLNTDRPCKGGSWKHEASCKPCELQVAMHVRKGGNGVFSDDYFLNLAKDLTSILSLLSLPQPYFWIYPSDFPSGLDSTERYVAMANLTALPRHTLSMGDDPVAAFKATATSDVLIGSKGGISALAAMVRDSKRGLVILPDTDGVRSDWFVPKDKKGGSNVEQLKSFVEANKGRLMERFTGLSKS